MNMCTTHSDIFILSLPDSIILCLYYGFVFLVSNKAQRSDNINDKKGAHKAGSHNSKRQGYTKDQLLVLLGKELPYLFD